MSRLRLTYDEERAIEAYARALADMMAALTGDSPCAKSYDPMTIEGLTMHSYAFNMKDGGRHHPVTDYETVDEIYSTLLAEAVDWIKQDTTP